MGTSAKKEINKQQTSACCDSRTNRSPFSFLLSSLFLSRSLALSRVRVSDKMPKNKGKGGKNRKRGKNEADDEKRELVFKEDGQEYAQVISDPFQLCILFV